MLTRCVCLLAVVLCLGRFSVTVYITCGVVLLYGLVVCWFVVVSVYCRLYVSVFLDFVDIW